MSYDIYIGNAEQTALELEDGEWSCVWNGVTVPGMARTDAPTFPHDDMTGNGNSRHPGYSQWGEFCRETGLHALFFDKEDGLMRRHPGTFALTPSHLATVREALAHWKSSHPDAVPGWDYTPGWTGPKYEDDGVRERDGVLARLLWLEWWMDYALRNCPRPAIHNH